MNRTFIDAVHRRITWRYAVGLCLFTAIIAGEQFTTYRIVESEKHDAFIINTSSNQQTLVSLIMFQLYRLSAASGHHEDIVDGSSIPGLIEEMHGSWQLLTKGDATYGISAPTDPRITARYFGDDRSLDQTVTRFLRDAHKAYMGHTMGAAINGEVSALVSLGGQIISRLDIVSVAYQDIAQEKIVHLRNVQKAHILGLLALLLVEILFIFRPMARRVREAMNDLLAEKEKVDAVLSQQSRVASFAENAPDPILRLSADGHIRYANTAARDIARDIRLGTVALEPAMGLPVADVIASNQPLEFLLISNEIIYDGMATPHVNDGFLNLYLRDITGLKEAETKLMKSQRLEAIGQLTGGIAHDFNNLLMVVAGNLDLAVRRLKRGSEHTDKVVKLLEAALGATERSSSITQSLLAFSRRQPLKPKPANPASVIEQFLPLLSNTAGEALNMTNANLLGSNTQVVIDEGQFEVALLNLILNARDAVSPGGCIHVETKRVSIPSGTYEDVPMGDYVRVSVTDNGKGIPAEDRDHILEPFFTTKDVGKGSGLGLPMVWGFVKQSGGHMTIYSEAGIGTTIQMYFPVVRGQPERPSRTAHPILSGQLQVVGPVLIVEDDDRIAETVNGMVTALGFKAITATSGERASSILKDRKDIQIVLADVILEGRMNGLELADIIEKTDRNIPVILMSGFPDGSVPLLENRRILTKPFSRTDLFNEFSFALTEA